MTYCSFVTFFIPSSRYGTIFSFMYTRAGAPPGRTGFAFVADVIVSAVGVPAAPVAVPAVGKFDGSLVIVGCGIVGGRESGGCDCGACAGLVGGELELELEFVVGLGGYVVGWAAG